MWASLPLSFRSEVIATKLPGPNLTDLWRSKQPGIAETLQWTSSNGTGVCRDSFGVYRVTFEKQPPCY